MIGVADHHHVAPLRGGALGQLLHLRHERAGRVNHALGARLKLALHFGRDAVGADDGGLAVGDFAGRVDGAHPLGLEPLNLLRVVDERPQRAHGRVLRERPLDHLHGALDAETEPVLFGQQNLHKKFSAFSTQRSAFFSSERSSFSETRTARDEKAES